MSTKTRYLRRGISLHFIHHHLPAAHPSSARNIDAGSGGATSTAQSEASAVDMAVGGGREGSQGSIGERGDPKKKVKARLKAARSALDDDDFKDF